MLTPCRKTEWDSSLQSDFSFLVSGYIKLSTCLHLILASLFTYLLDKLNPFDVISALD